MRGLLRYSVDGGLTPAAPYSHPLTPPPATSANSAGPNFMLALLVLVGVSAFLGTAWIIFRLVCACRGPAGARLSAGPDERDHSLRRAALSGIISSTDLETGISFNGNTLDIAPRSDSMVTRASAWARAILAGEAPPPVIGHPSSFKAGSAWDTVSVPVKHAVVVMQPTGEAALGVTSDAEERQRDVMIQVDCKELLGIDSTGSEALGRRQRSQRRQHELASALAPATESAAEDDDGRSEDSTDSLTARSRSVELAAAESGLEEDAAADEERSQKRKRRRRRRRGTCEAACQTE